MVEIGDLKITTLAENLVQAGGLGQWGLSFLLELVDAGGDARKVVFDTGANREALMHNVKLMEVDLGDVDCVVISHGHGDHTAATVEVVEAAGGVRVHGHPHTFLPRFYVDRDGKRHRGGPPEGEGLADIEDAGGEVVLSARGARRGGARGLDHGAGREGDHLREGAAAEGGEQAHHSCRRRGGGRPDN